MTSAQMADLELERVPCKTQKDNKMGKETATPKVLMSVIKTVASASPEHKNKEKAELERKFQQSEEELRSSIAKQHVLLSTVMTTFAHACRDIKKAKTKLSEVKKNLQQSKTSLSSRHEELRHLWMEGMEHKHALQILEQIEKLKSNRGQYFELMNKIQESQDQEGIVAVITSWMEELEKVEDGLGDKDNNNNGPSDVKIEKEEEIQPNSNNWLIDFTDNSNGIASTKDKDDGVSDINNFFLRKKPARNEKVPLFKFEYSLHGLRQR